MKKALLYFGIFIFLFNGCEKEADLTNTTNKIRFSDFIVTDTNYRSVKVSTVISNYNNIDITQHGHCWSINQTPTLSHNKTELGALNSEVFYSNPDSLEHNTEYSIRAYIVFDDIYYLSDSVFFFKTNEIKVPSLTDIEFNEVTETGAVVSCRIEEHNGGEITMMGICWNMTGNPTISDIITIVETVEGNYLSEMFDLEYGKTYFVKAYAKNEIGIGYSNQRSLKIEGDIIQVQDYDGNWYNTLKIGNQIWLKENLKTTHYSNGDPIENGDGIDINSEFSPAYYFNYDNNEANAEIYGRLYTWYAALNACPDGWHMATENEWQTLINYIGNENEGRLKSTGILEDGSGLWKSPNAGATDLHGFSMLPAGFYSAQFYNYFGIGERSMFVYADNGNGGGAFKYDDDYLTGLGTGLNFGHSVRCIKDE
ncbi:MAG: hypothetical protein KOO66_06995 [Bacteroidales bacterium]|nr:hypothetical protein [Bacteroidales bacterium]